MYWDDIQSPKNCYASTGGADQDLSSLGAGFTIDTCKEKCESHSTCDCITFHTADGRCWLRKSCHIDRCTDQANFQVVTGTRGNI